MTAPSRGNGALAAGLLVAPLGVGAAVAAPLAGRISDRLGARNLALAGGLAAAFGAFAFTGQRHAIAHDRPDPADSPLDPQAR
ncbi:MAG TPA: hypothetical protein VF223_22260 [Trebonia sp.]